MRVRAEVAHRLDCDPPAFGLLADGLLIVGVGQADGHVQAGGYSADGRLRKRVGEPIDERVAPSAVAGAHPAQVAVEFSAGEEICEGVLLDPGCAPVGEQLLS